MRTAYERILMMCFLNTTACSCAGGRKKRKVENVKERREVYKFLILDILLYTIGNNACQDIFSRSANWIFIDKRWKANETLFRLGLRNTDIRINIDDV